MNYIEANGLYVSGNLVVYDSTSQIPLCLSFIDKAKGKVRGVLAGIQLGNNIYCRTDDNVRRNNITFYKCDARKGKGIVLKVEDNKESFYQGIWMNQNHPKSLITTSEYRDEDFYNYLMENYDLPLKKEWSSYIFENFYMNRNITDATAVWGQGKIYLHGKWVNDVSIYHIEITQEALEEVVSDAIRKKRFVISDNKDIDVADLDEYMLKFKPSLWSNIVNNFVPLVHSKTDEIYAKCTVFLTKRLYAKQQEMVMGVVKSLQNGNKYAIMNEGMGVGKTIQSLGVITEFFHEKYIRANWKKDSDFESLLKESYEKGRINYRNIVICPAHLCAKWQEEIESEIPFAKVTILNELSQLVELREHGPKRDGKEFYIIGKDFAKLGSSMKPVPYQMKKKQIMVPACRNCYDEKGLVRLKNKLEKCSCGCEDFIPVETDVYGKALICPECGNPILKMVSSTEDDKLIDALLRPWDFSNHTSENDRCFVCGSSFWAPEVKNIGANKEPKWYKITHFANKSHKSKATSFVLKGYEDQFLELHDIKKFVPMSEGGFEKTKSTAGRRVAPSSYIKKYLKGYFDFAILDEVHKFEGLNSAQSIAAHALVNAADYSLGLTGTISNGTALAIFALFWLLDPKKMVEHGYKRTDELKFAKMYGVLESVYESSGRKNYYGKMTRGRQVSPPKVKPGISPRLLLDFMVENSVFMDITDLGSQLPELNERIELVDMPEDVEKCYKQTLSELKDAIRTEGMGAMSNILQLGLSYPDKPYDRDPIKSTKFEDVILTQPTNLEYYKDHLLPKEEKLVEIVGEELSQGRNCFVFCSFTGAGDGTITERLGGVLRKELHLSEKEVQVMYSTSPVAKEREAYIKKKAAEGVKVFILNPKMCETGLDFCFTYEGKDYNYPTILFYQLTYELAVLWQASRRHYRANQTKECRTYWMAYSSSLQTAALQIMGEKQIAVSAVQGKFSSEGLASMSKSANAQEKLANALLSQDFSSKEKLGEMFEKVNASNHIIEDDFEFKEALLYSELMGIEEIKPAANDSSFSAFDEMFAFFDAYAEEEPEEVEEVSLPEEENSIDDILEIVVDLKASKKDLKGQLDFASLFCA